MMACCTGAAPRHLTATLAKLEANGKMEVKKGAVATVKAAAAVPDSADTPEVAQRRLRVALLREVGALTQ